MSLTVIGGTGFLGKDLLKYGLNKYKTVNSVSRHRPYWDSWWVNKINFKQMQLQDLFTTIDNSVDPVKKSNMEVLNVDTTIYSVGTLFASSLYKRVLNDQDFSMLPRWVRQELQYQSNGAPLYDTLHYQYPIQVLNAFKEKCDKENPYFVYISAHSFLSEDVQYIKTKRMAEDFLLGQVHKTNKDKEIKVLIARPGLLYNENRPISMLLAGLNQMVSCSPIDFPSPLRTSQVAEAIYTAIEQNQTGILEVHHLLELAK